MLVDPLPADHPLGKPVSPSPDEPGDFADQIAAVGLSLYFAAKRRSTAAAEWDDARRLVIPHARTGDDS